MNKHPEPPKDSVENPQPVAYDTDGRPLYHHPPASESASEPKAGPQYVHMIRPIDPEPHEVPPKIQAKHEESLQQYPELNLSRGEYVILAIHRHPIGAIASAGVALFLICLIGAFTIGLPVIGESLGFSRSVYLPLVIIGGLLMLLIAVGGYIAVWVYNRNEFYLTNESVIQEIQNSLFSRHEQTVSLGNIEDASYQQHGVIQYMFNYGMIRLSTEGDETTYRFPYASNPKEQVKVLNNAVEAFKNGRPVFPPDDDNDD